MTDQVIRFNTVQKPYKLKATDDGPITRDSLSAWATILKSYCRQNTDWQRFLPGGTTSTWTAFALDETRGILVQPTGGVSQDQAEELTNQRRSNLEDFITCVASMCPDGFFETIIRECTSFTSVLDLIKSTFNLETKGERILITRHFKVEKNESYMQAYMRLRSFYLDATLQQGTNFKGAPVTQPEKLSPLAECMIVEKWLNMIDSKLPDHVLSTRSYLFTPQKPTLACNVKELSDQIDTMLGEINASEQAEANLISAVNRLGIQQPAYRNQRSYNQQRNFRPQTRQQMIVRNTGQSCSYCLGAGRTRMAQEHPTFRCPRAPRQFPPSNRVQNVAAPPEEYYQEEYPDQQFQLQMQEQEPLYYDAPDEQHSQLEQI